MDEAKLLSLEQEDSSGLTSSWVLKQRMLARAVGEVTHAKGNPMIPPPGTTFPPLAQHLPYLRERLRTQSLREANIGRSCRCLSEPDLGQHHRQEEEEEEDCESKPSFIDHGNDEDYLFEFDIGSPVTSEDDIAFNQITNVNLVETEYEDAVAETMTRMRRSCSICSDSSSLSCGHEKSKDFEISANIFGSRSSGLGSDRRSEEDEPDGLDLEPDDWRDTCDLYLEEAISGSATPILPVSPGTETPILSPDSCLDEENHLEDQNLCLECGANRASEAEPINNVDSVDASSADSVKNVTFGDDSDASVNINNNNINNNDLNSERDNTDASTDRLTNLVDETEELASHDLPLVTICEEASKPNSNTQISLNPESNPTAGSLIRADVEISEVKEEVAPPAPAVKHMKGDTKIEVSPNLRVSSDKLQSLLGKLEQDKPFSKESSPTATRSKSYSFGSRLSPPSSRRDSGDDEKPKLRKCSSLRSGKTPPTTPGQTKIVRFADIFGLEISEVKVFLDEIPKVPKSAYQDLNVDPSEFAPPPLPSPSRRGSAFPGAPRVNYSAHAPGSMAPMTLVPMFNQPGGLSTFFEQVQSRKVCLENAFSEGSTAIQGVVRVLNIAFHKTVTVRWTTNDWMTVTEQQGSYVPGSSHGNTDKFSFKISLGALPVGARLQLCIKYSCAGEHWDSNGGGNYVFQVFPGSSSGASNFGRSQPVGISVGQPSLNLGSTGGLSQPAPFSSNSTSSGGQPWGHSPSQHGDDPWLRFM